MNHLKIPKPNENIKLDSFIEYFPELMALKGTIQDSYFHAEGDVWIHTEMVCNALVRLPQYAQACEQDRFILFYAALLHDIAKPKCTKIEQGRVTSRGHSKMGEIDARILLWKQQVEFFSREKICAIIEKHQVPFFALNAPDIDKFTIELSWDVPIWMLIAVAKADMQGRICVEQNSCLQDIELFEDFAKEIDCYDKPFEFPDVHTKMKFFEPGSNIAPDYPFFKETKSTVYVLSGLPASGKSSWRAQNKHIPCVSFDDARAFFKLKPSDNDGQAVHWVIDRAKEYLRQGVDFVWDATHLSKQMRGKTLDLVHQYHAKSILVYCEAPFEVVLQRNNQRDSTLPNKKLQEMFFKWEVPKAKEAYDIQYVFTK